MKPSVSHNALLFLANVSTLKMYSQFCAVSRISPYHRDEVFFGFSLAGLLLQIVTCLLLPSLCSCHIHGRQVNNSLIFLLSTPLVTWIRTGIPKASTARWIFVLSPLLYVPCLDFLLLLRLHADGL